MLTFLQGLYFRFISTHRTHSGSRCLTTGTTHFSSSFSSHVSCRVSSNRVFTNVWRGCYLHCSSSVTSGTGFQPSNPPPVDAAGSGSGCDAASETDICKWNLAGLKTEIARNHLRTYKKCAKATERYQKGMKIYQDILAMESPSQEVLESCPDVDKLREILETMKTRLNVLMTLEESFKTVESKNDERYKSLAEQALELGLNDQPPPKAPKGRRKQKGPRKQAPRKPYNLYRSLDGIEIWVGRSSSDNDQLSCNPEYRDGSDWWMHVSGSPGSHVVIKCTDDDFPTKYEDTLLDAALLAAQYSKGKKAGRVPVSLTRCRNVFKPKGFVAGMVRLTGTVGTVSVDVNRDKKRLERLEQIRNT